MKIIHCADVHLDAKMDTSLPKEKAWERKQELMHTFMEMLEYADVQEVKAILISGDLFDTEYISDRVKNFFIQAIKDYCDIQFYYICGNHDNISFFENLNLENLHLFSEKCNRYVIEDVCIMGINYKDQYESDMYDTLKFDPKKKNILMMHGNIKTITQNGSISIAKLREKNIDYLALGHFHTFTEDKIDERGVWCYPGCLEGRGFDETGEKGFVLLDVEEDKITRLFVPFSSRVYWNKKVNLEGCMTLEEIKKRIMSEVPSISKDILKLTLFGNVSKDTDISIKTLEEWLRNDWYYAKVIDKTKFAIVPKDYQYDVTLRGEFIRTVMSSDINKEDKDAVLRYGLNALAGR